MADFGGVLGPDLDELGGASNTHGGILEIPPPTAGLPPEIGSWDPAADATVVRDDSIAVTVTEGSELALVCISVRYGALGVEELAYDGTAFTAAYAGSTRTDLVDGARFTLRRTGGWLDALEVRVAASDENGAWAAGAAAFEVAGVLELVTRPAPPATFARPTLPELLERIRADFRELPGGESPLFRRSVEAVLVRVLGGLTHGLHGHLAAVAESLLPDRGAEETVLRWSRMLGVPPREAAPASGPVAFAAAGGTSIPAGATMVRSDGAVFEALADADEDGGTITVTVEAVIAGAAGSTPSGATLTLQSPISGVATAGAVGSDGLTGGRDADTVDVLRQRVLQRLAQPPRGGAEGDYVRWALEVDAVAQAWVTPQGLGPGTVVVAFVVDGNDPIPSSADVAAVQAHLDARRPATAQVTVLAPVAVPLDYAIQLSPDTLEVRAAVVEALRDLHRSEAVPGQVLRISHIREAISGAAGEEDHVLVSPTADVDPGPNGLVTVGTFTWS